MISRTRVLQVKNLDVNEKTTEVRLTAPTSEARTSDTYLVVVFDTSKQLLRDLAEQHGKRYRVTIEEVE
mgnify:CR=1 FL=1